MKSGNSHYPLVSVVIPAYNSAAFIGEAIDSALAQDYPNIEVIVVNDGSTDGTAAILDAYGARIRLLSQPNKGCAAARNLGVKNARGVYVAFLDADDAWWRHKISYQCQSLAETGYRMAYSRFVLWRPGADGQYPAAETLFHTSGNPVLSDCALVTGSTYRALLLDCIVWTSTVIIEKSLLDEVGAFDESLELGEDYDLWLRLSRRIEMLGLEQATALYRSHAHSITRSVKALNHEYLVISRSLAAWGEGIPGARPGRSAAIEARLARSMFNHGYTHYKNGDPRIAAASFLMAIKHGDVRFKSVLLLMISTTKSLFVWKRPPCPPSRGGWRNRNSHRQARDQ
jgi:glycosyltransferase involved in cell wall biosynthesis